MSDTGAAKRKAYQKGHRSEWLAVWALRIKGFHIAEMRFKTKAGEVDIIARRGNLVLMVEVKARRTLEEAMEAVTPLALKRIEAAGDIWLKRQKNISSLSIRYDLIACLPARWPTHIPAIYTP